MSDRAKVVVVCPGLFKGDAVGVAAWQTYRSLAAFDRFDVSAIWATNDYDDVRGAAADGLAGLRSDRRFREADVIIYVFAAFHEFFDAVADGNGHAAQIVRFHNVTPRALMPSKHWDFIDRSFAQIPRLAAADAFWADSRENREELLRHGIAGDKIEIVPLAVALPTLFRASDKPSHVVEMFYVGRIFGSKGIVDLVLAAEELRSLTARPFRLVIGGNLRFSDPDYVETVRRVIAERRLESCVDFVGTLQPEELAARLRRANIYVTGSRHEGFCVPVIEGLAAGCIPVSYANSNLRYVADGWGRLAADDTPEALAAVLGELVEALSASSSPNRPVPLDRGTMSVAAFDRGAGAYARSFSLPRFSDAIARRVRTLATAGAAQPVGA